MPCRSRCLPIPYATLGIAEADLVQAARLSNPSWTYRRTQRGDALSVESVVTASILELATMPLRTRIEARRFEETKLVVGDAVLTTAATVRTAYFDAVAAAQSARYLDEVHDAAAASAELARRMVTAGNWSKLAAMREHLFLAETLAQRTRAGAVALASREKLARAMGLADGGAPLTLVERLPGLPGEPAPLPDLERHALAERLDLRAARLHTESVAASLGLSRATRFVDVLEAGSAWTKDAPDPAQRGYEVTLSVPLFDWGDARVAKAEAAYRQAVAQYAQAAVDARSDVRDAYARYLTSYDLARHYRDVIVPMRKRIGDENLLRYNGMLVGVFELLADSREQILAVNASIEALRDFWVAETALRRAAGGRIPDPEPALESSAPPALSPIPRERSQ